MMDEKAQLRAQMAAMAARLAEIDQSGVYEDEGSGRWYCKVKIDGGWTIRRRFPDGRQIVTRDQALEAKGEWTAADARHEVVRGKVYFADFWEAYVRSAQPDMEHGSWVDLRGHGHKRLLPHFGGMLLTSINVEVVDDWRSLMFERVSAGDIAPKTINNSRTALMGCFKRAVAQRKMAFNPAVFVRPLKVANVEPPYLAIGQQDAYLAACSVVYRELAEFLMETGVRVSEGIAVRVDDLDLHGCSVRIARQLDKDGGTKTTKSNRTRTVYFSPALADTLRGLLGARLADRVEDDGWLFLVPPPKRGRHAGRTTPKPPHRKTVHDWHEAALRAAGIADMPLHALRHTAAANWLATTSGDLEFVKRQLGHSTLKTTSDFYGHMNDEQRRAQAKLSAAVLIERRRQASPLSQLPLAS